MPFSRRSFLHGAALASLFPSAFVQGCATADPGAFRVAAATDDTGRPGVAFVRGDESTARFVETPMRGHGLAAHPQRPAQVAMFGRRPGTTSVLVDLEQARLVGQFDVADARAFQGHGFFSQDGRQLILCEADVQTAEGWLAVYDADSHTRLGAFPTGGIGPHETRLMPDGDTVVVANGGLLTRPETGREVLNLDTMDSTLTYVSLSRGEVLETVRVDVPKGSIRHLDLTSDGTVVFAIQVQRDAVGHETPLPLVGRHRRGGAPTLFTDRLDATATMNDYVGSVAVCEPLGIVGTTSPRGDVTLFWHLDSGAYMDLHQLVDGSGVAVLDTRFVLSSSVGELRVLDAEALTEIVEARRRFEHVRWDNHLTAVVASGTP